MKLPAPPQLLLYNCKCPKWSSQQPPPNYSCTTVSVQSEAPSPPQLLLYNCKCPKWSSQPPQLLLYNCKCPKWSSQPPPPQLLLYNCKCPKWSSQPPPNYSCTTVSVQSEAPSPPPPTTQEWICHRMWRPLRGHLDDTWGDYVFFWGGGSFEKRRLFSTSDEKIVCSENCKI